MGRLPRWMRLTFWIGLGLFAVIQVVPYGARPRQPTRDAGGRVRTRRRARPRAGHVPGLPQQRDHLALVLERRADVVVDPARCGPRRAALNFSEWDRSQETKDLIEIVEDGEMPPFTYTLLHPEARLTEEERATLIAALQEVLADAPPDQDDHSGPG